ncbi:MAG: hypothetical protein QOJ91_790 [Sphingomonadales bacterium]|jgi:hypothetical protein|nr:hypothetical protein [Sphingomonadales bacterium]
MGADAPGGGDARAATLALLARRAEGATVCPSEVARALAAPAGEADWRGAMPAVHAEIDRMVADGLVQLSWKGVEMAVREGPYRIGRARPDDRSAPLRAGPSSPSTRRRRP